MQCVNLSKLSTLAILGRLQAEAEGVWGATAPNPPVAAALISASGQILASAAHPKAGAPHAEVLAIQKARSAGTLEQAKSLWVTLEPCNHHGRTPPCTEAILATGIQEIVTVFKDPNPQVAGKGNERLRAAGRSVTDLTDPTGIALSTLDPEVRAAIAAISRPLMGFFKYCKTGLPWVVVKTAEREGLPWPEAMIPPQGQKTFTRESSLLFAHELRKRVDAILTGSGTWIADQPQFTVRKTLDHSGKNRLLGIADRRGRVLQPSLVQARENGFEVEILKSESLETTLKRWATRGVREVLVEAGPTFARSILDSGLWDEHVIVRSGQSKDEIEVRRAAIERSR